MHRAAEWNAAQARELIAAETVKARAFLGDDGPDVTALLPALHALQHRFGYIHDEALELLAHHFNRSKAEVKGVVSFYKDFRRAPPGRHLVALCRAEACQARGSEEVAAHLERAHGLRPGGTSGDVTLENTYCLGNCALGPAALVDEARLWGRLDAEGVERLLASLRTFDGPPKGRGDDGAR